jgi:hypothetical protein
MWAARVLLVEMTSSPRFRVWLRRLGWVVLVLTLLLSVLLLGIAVSMQTVWGRDKIRQLLTEQVSQAIDGSMRVEELVELSFSHARVRGLTFADPRGVSVVTVEEARVHLVLASLLDGTVHFDHATANGVTLLVTRGVENSTSLADAFAATGSTERDRAAGKGVRFRMDRVLVEDAAVTVRMGSPLGLHVSTAGVSIDHDPARRRRGERATNVMLDSVYANLHMDGREAISGTDIRAAGSIFDLRGRACHRRGLIAVRILFGQGGGPQLVYSTRSRLIRTAMRIASRRTSMSMRYGGVNLHGVPRCGPPPSATAG